MNRCEVAGCGAAAWTEWMGFDLCKECAEAVAIWDAAMMTRDEAAFVLLRIGENLRTYGSRSADIGPTAD